MRNKRKMIKDKDKMKKIRKEAKKKLEKGLKNAQTKLSALCNAEDYQKKNSPAVALTPKELVN